MSRRGEQGVQGRKCLGRAEGSAGLSPPCSRQSLQFGVLPSLLMCPGNWLCVTCRSQWFMIFILPFSGCDDRSQLLLFMCPRSKFLFLYLGGVAGKWEGPGGRGCPSPGRAHVSALWGFRGSPLGISIIAFVFNLLGNEFL